MEAVMAAVESDLEVEQALLEDIPLFAVLPDHSKLFDMVPWGMIWLPRDWWGIPQGGLSQSRTSIWCFVPRF